MEGIRKHIEQQLIDFGDGFIMVVNAVNDIGQAILYLGAIPYNKLYKLESGSSNEVEKNDNPNPETRL